jgi:hypothetical protein
LLLQQPRPQQRDLQHELQLLHELQQLVSQPQPL